MAWSSSSKSWVGDRLRSVVVTTQARLSLAASLLAEHLTTSYCFVDDNLFSLNPSFIASSFEETQLIVTTRPINSCNIVQTGTMDQFIDETPTSVSATLIMPTPKSTLENLPSEVLSKICSNLLGGKTPICVNIARRVKDDQRPTFQRGVPEVFQQLKNLLSTSKTLRAHAQAWLARECQLYARSNNFTYFSEIFGRGNTILIQHLDLRLSFNEKIAHEKEWPKLLNMLVSELPHLANFKLSTSWQTGRPPYPPHESGDSFDSLTREGQETRTILRLGSFLILRHPTLRRMIWPADSGQTFEANENQSTVYVVLDRGMHKKPGDLKRTWKSVTKWTDETRASKVLSQVRLRGF